MNATKTIRPTAATNQPPYAGIDTGATFKERYAAGKALRENCPREAHAAWKPAANRPDPVQMVLASEQGRVAELLPLRHGRMVKTPFTFYRGAASTMASDLASTPVSGMRVQCCGDAHLCNFGGFATPERKIIFSINDLDESLPAPWEWDVKRLAASFVVACRDKGIRDGAAKDIAATCVRSYRESMAEFSRMNKLELWYRALGAEELMADLDPARRKRIMKRIEKEKAKSRAEVMFPKLVGDQGGPPVIMDQLPTIFHVEGHRPGEIQKIMRDAMASYRESLPHSVQGLLDHYELRDAVVKVVGVGSVGTLCWVFLFTAGDDEPLFLQVKEARASVLEPYAGASALSNHGERVVNGYRLMQPASDMFLGWARGPKRDFFIRQLRDTKISILVDTLNRAEMDICATWCGKALALSHARTGNAAALSGYMGNRDSFDRAIAAFSVAYADQNESDHAALDRAVRSGKVKAVFEEAG
ncbi:DUF2252 domain-containing protein [Rhodoferax sp.]|uniref:DUF2252 domain-containing protein n=1 Tax=Rhodoferax sp. TaxID=50421 RepID=UPI0025E3C1D2|nr:DUF2252 domain-containing protein [Rhodoferax sp.]